ncbi:ABC transporter substrate-binding protein [Salimicrobium album]|uniref:Spermidine/putrescine transport system substrate-binding protein n=1 Tax=Salimicrobium album TaxID=50717 RepID=A0A1H3BJ83_9BACI|nr:ABC transporter substrate-binding protein [Salimicrobium album]SDX41781.1 putative spermidine/putrescine transport system substrate-binding protein [Salimicrobium album]
MRIGIIAIMIILSGCSGVTDTEEKGSTIANRNFEEIKDAAEGTEVRLFMWGGDDGINTYIDEWVAPRLQEKFGISLTRTPMATEDILQKLRTEREAGKKEGTVDLLWLNGENFRNAKNNELLYGAFTEKLPNFNEYYDRDEYSHDFGTATEGMEAPWGRVQFALQYDSAKVDEPPRTYKELSEWVKENPGEFTYPHPSEFTGNAFLRQMMLSGTENPEALAEDSFSPNAAETAADGMWKKLREWEPALYRKGEYYPASLSELDRLYSEGKVSMTLGYNEARSEHLINDGVFPESTDTYVMDSGSLGNTHFLSIPYNSTNVPGAVTAINFLLSPEAQLQKMKPSSWGDNTTIDTDKLPEETKQRFEELDRGETVPGAEKLEETYLPELDTEYVEWITETWEDEVVR